MNENRKIQIIDADYHELFSIPDGGSIVVTRPDGEEHIGVCKYLDETHFQINGSCWHICQFAEMVENSGASVKPETEPEINHGYRIIQRVPACDKSFKFGFNPEAVQKYVTWQSYPDNSDRYDWGHYWSDKSIAKRDLFLRADAERRGIPYDHTKLIKQSRIREAVR